MNANHYWIEMMWAEYRDRRMKESNQLRLLDEIQALPRRSAWRWLAFVLARGLIALGNRLQTAAEGYRRPVHETC